jgi:hypothetical protein
MCGKAEPSQGGVHGIGDVEEGVEQRSVEVKYDGTESYAVSLSVTLAILTRVTLFTLAGDYRGILQDYQPNVRAVLCEE